MSYQCCFCGKDFEGENEYEVPEGFPTNSTHEHKPLCVGCGSLPTPTLDEICQKLDAELKPAKPPMWPPRRVSRQTLLN
jgi:hypothetical protein